MVYSGSTEYWRIKVYVSICPVGTVLVFPSLASKYPTGTSAPVRGGVHVGIRTENTVFRSRDAQHCDLGTVVPEVMVRLSWPE
jgi:hypothetical protein